MPPPGRKVCSFVNQNCAEWLTSSIYQLTALLKESNAALSTAAGNDTLLCKGGRASQRAHRAGTPIGLPIYVIHRHRKLWDDPDRFDPSRFAPEREASYSRYQFMPFGAGPRICIGAAFALIEATAMLATLVRAARFESRPVQEPIPIWRVVLLPKDGMPLQVTVRRQGI